MNQASNVVLQFGAGNFLRAFFCRFVHEMNEAGQTPPVSVVVVQSTEGDRARLLNEAEGHFYVVVRGQENGQAVERVEEVASVERALVADNEWDDVLAIARSPRLIAITSNTTEAGLALDPKDNTGPPEAGTAPYSFPAKLTAVLWERFTHGLPGVLILPCELIADNADTLRSLVVEQATRWGWASQNFTDWLQNACTWANTLVDGIVSGRPSRETVLPTIATLLDADPLLTVAEPFRFFAVENKLGTEWLRHPDIALVPDVRPFALRKVRILNGAHTSLLMRVRQTDRDDIQFVRQAVADPDLREWLHGLLFEEVVPTVASRVDGAETFAHQTLERFANPYLDHRFSDIALHHDTKIKVRLVPTRNEYEAQFGRLPPRLTALMEREKSHAKAQRR